ncbi:MAG: sigma-54 dependent transcriptional regulator [Pseudomonadota bacterium]
MTKRRPADILIVEDTPSFAAAYKQYLRGEPYTINHVDTGKAALAALEISTPDAMLLDLQLPDMNGMEILRHCAEADLSTAVIVVTAHGSVNVAVEAMRAGAFDFLMKPFAQERVVVTLRNALERRELTQLVETYQKTYDRHTYRGFTGSSLAMQAVYTIVDSAAPSNATVFITGESGTGKEVCAKSIHDASPRRKGPFITLNCAAIPKDLIESELFGHVKGAFTSAVADRDGAAQRAHGGTLFLDEICEMDISLQSKLLRFVQTGEVQKVGGSKTQTVDVRFVCATNRDPLQAVKEKQFREDLYYRLHVIPIEMPPLHARGGDVMEIANHLLEAYAEEEKKPFNGFDPEAKAVLSAYEWPGNVRQLQNVIRNVVVLNSGGTVSREMLPLILDTADAREPGPADDAMAPSPEPTADQATNRFPSAGDADARSEIRPLAEVEKELVEDAIRLCGGSIAQAAAHLGVDPSTIYRKRQTWKQRADAE